MFRSYQTYCPDCGEEYIKNHPRRVRCPDCQREWTLQRERERWGDRILAGASANLSIKVLACPALPGDDRPYFPVGSLFSRAAFVVGKLQPGRSVYECWLPGMVIQHIRTGKTYRINKARKLEAA